MRYACTRTHRGFLLIETLVYVAVTVLVTLVTVNMYFSLDDVLLRNKTERMLTNAATVTLERMVRDIRDAITVDTGGSTLDTSPGVLELTAGATTTRFFLSGGNVVVEVNGVELGPLTSDDVIVEDLLFRHYVGPNTEFVRVEMTLSAASKAASTTKTYYTSAVLRGSYE